MPPSRRRWTTLMLAGFAAVVLIVAAVIVTRRAPTGVDRARALVADDARFSTAEGTGVTFVKVAQVLRDEGESCLRKSSRSPAARSACARYFSASAYAQVSAVRVLSCTRPGVFDARAAMRGYLDDLARGHNPAVPATLTCR